MNTVFKKLIWFVVIVAIVGGGYLAHKSFFKPQSICWPYCPEMTDQDREEIKKSALEAETTTWKTYTSEKYGFEFKYPSTLRLKEEAGTVNVYTEKQSLAISLPKKLSSDTTIEDWIISDKYYPTPILKEKMTLGGEVGNRVSIFGIEGRTQDVLYVIHKNEGYRIFLASETEPVLSQILSTFKFTN